MCPSNFLIDSYQNTVLIRGRVWWLLLFLRPNDQSFDFFEIFGVTYILMFISIYHTNESMSQHVFEISADRLWEKEKTKLIHWPIFFYTLYGMNDKTIHIRQLPKVKYKWFSLGLLSKVMYKKEHTVWIPSLRIFLHASRIAQRTVNIHACELKYLC